MNRDARQKVIFYLESFLETKEVSRFFELCSEFLGNYELRNLSDADTDTKCDNSASAIVILGNDVNASNIVSNSGLNLVDFNFCFQVNVTGNLEMEGFKHIQPKRMIIDLVSSIKNKISPIVNDEKYGHLELEIEKLQARNTYPGDLFLRLKNGKLIKVFNKGDVIDDRLSRYKEKGVNRLLVSVKDFYQFDSSTLKKLYDLDSFLKDPTSEYKRHMDTIYSVSRELGVSDVVILNVEEIMGKFGKMIKEPKLKKLLDEFNSFPGTFMFKHSYLISLLCVAIVKKLDWGSEENLGKFCLAAMLHDLAYSDVNHVQYEAMELLTTDFPEDIRSEALNHAEMMANKLEKNKDIHDDVIKMVRYHHFLDYRSVKDMEVGVGRLNKHACLFIMIHNLVLGMYKVMFDRRKVPALIEGVARQFEDTIYKPIAITFKTHMFEILGKEIYE
jgi:hypothetical protein